MHRHLVEQKLQPQVLVVYDSGFGLHVRGCCLHRARSPCMARIEAVVPTGHHVAVGIFPYETILEPPPERRADFLLLGAAFAAIVHARKRIRGGGHSIAVIPVVAVIIVAVSN